MKKQQQQQHNLMPTKRNDFTVQPYNLNWNQSCNTLKGKLVLHVGETVKHTLHVIVYGIKS